MPFTDRVDAGRKLAERLGSMPTDDLVVLGLPRGGVPVAFEVAQRLGAPLDVIMVRKLGVPGQPELAGGAIGEGGVRVMNEELLQAGDLTTAALADTEQRETRELERQARRFRRDRPGLDVSGKTAVVVDDGVATGATARAACQVVRAHGAARVVLAVPVAAPEVVESLRAEVDEVVCLETPERLIAIGQWYRDFSQTSDDEVIALLDRASNEDAGAADPPAKGAAGKPRDVEVEVLAGQLRLPGHLVVPERALGTVVFAHGSGSSRHSPRNGYVASVLNKAGIATLLFDLLTAEEEADRGNVFDIEMLARRLSQTAEWLRGDTADAPQPMGYFGASTGAGAALWAAAEPGAEIAAIVSRGGRPDLAGPKLDQVRAPTLLIVGGDDAVVLDMNRSAQEQLRCRNRLTVIPGATHLFEESGTLEAAAMAARDWFVEQFRGS